MPELVTIRKAAELSGLTAKTVRFYEDEGLVTPAARSAAGYRLFCQGDVRRLRLIRRAKILGLPLADIKEFADLAFQESCGEFEAGWFITLRHCPLFMVARETWLSAKGNREFSAECWGIR